MSFGLIEIFVIVIFILIVFFFVWLLRGGDRQRMPVASDISQIDWSVFERDDVIQAISRGNKIEAIKIYRECTDQGLAESKFAVEYAIKHPESVKSGKGRIASNIPSDAGIRDLIAEGRIEEAITI